MTSGLPDWMRGPRTQRFGGAPNELGRRPPPHVRGQSSPDVSGAGQSGAHNPYAVGGPGPATTTGHVPVPPHGAPSTRAAQHDSADSDHGTAPPDAAAHYLPGAPAAAHPGSDSSRRPGLVALAVLLVLGSLAYLVWHSVTWLEPLVESLDHCPAERGMACFTSDPFQRWLYLPVLVVVIAWGFASGAATEGRQGRARGYLHLFAGVATLVIGGLVNSL